MRLILLLLVHVLSQASTGATPDAVATRLESARQTFYAAVDDARSELVATIDAKLEQAQRVGALEPVEELTQQKDAFAKQDVLPTSVSTRSFQRKVTVALQTLKKEFESGIRSFVQLGMIEDAKRVREELKSFEESPINRGNWGVAKYSITSGAGEFKQFANRVRAYPNRKYVWEDISPNWPIKRFAPVPGGKTEPIRLTVTSPGWVLVAISNEEPEKVRGYLEEHSWQATAYAFSYNAKGKTPMAIYRKQLPKGEHVIPRANFSGPVLLVP